MIPIEINQTLILICAFKASDVYRKFRIALIILSYIARILEIFSILFFLSECNFRTIKKYCTVFQVRNRFL